MDLYCLMGNPVEHSRSPWIHARLAELTGQRLDYGLRLAPVDGFGAAVEAFRRDAAGTARGCNVTVPFKFEAAALAQHLTPRAALAQAVNVLSFRDDGIHGDNSDGIGLVNDITRHAGAELAGRDLLLLGAGGAAAGVLGPLIEAGPRRLVVANRTRDKAIALAQRHAAWARQHRVTLEAQALDAISGAFDVLVNATASSLAGGTVPVPASVLKRGTLALDMMYGPAAAGFMDWARTHGATPRDGLGMLVEQAAEAFATWRGVRPPTAGVLAELRALIAARGGSPLAAFPRSRD
jgi:shikimate dehydrogenase